MAVRLDEMDRKILGELQADASQSLDEIARKVGSSKTPVWNRIRRMREDGAIVRTTAILDPEALGLEACFFVLIRTSEHEAEWQRRFLQALQERPEVLEAHRLAGDIDYNVTALLSMEEIKSTTVLPL
jgi:Lrp/AsnC family transcriptional regulator